MQSRVFDYAIIGAGAAGLNLLLAMLEDPFFRNKQILILEKETKDKNDRTWCFWETGTGRFDNIITQSWSKAAFITKTEKKSLDLEPYRYKMLRSSEFYAFAKEKISKAENVRWIKDEIIDLQKGTHVDILSGSQQFQAKQVFDSRIHPAFFEAKDQHTRILQHFKGWMIETKADLFHPDEFTMMDFRLKWKNSASFTYVLPLNPKKALVEFTLFTPELIREEDYDKMLKQYIRDFLNIDRYQTSETEQGVIPMSDFPFHNENSPQVMKIGTAGSWIKASSGYSFKNAVKYSRKIVDNLKAGNAPDKGLFNRRFQFYDSIFLEVLKKQNELGESLFTSMYHKNPIQRIFKFLDNETTLPEELKIMASFQQLPFLKALGRYIFK